MPGKSFAAFSENWIVWAILIAAFAVVGALLLWMAGHLALWWPMTGGMAGVIVAGAVLYAALIPIERMFRLGVDRRSETFIAVNLVASWGLSIWWGWTLGLWASAIGGADPDTLDAVLVFGVAIVCFWLTSNAVAQLFNGAIYMWGSLFTGLIAFAIAAAFG